MSEVTDALQVFLGSAYVNDFDFNNRSYRVYVQADQQFRADPSDLRPALRPRRRRIDGPPRQRGAHARDHGAAGHQPLQPVPLGRDQRRARRPGTSSGQALQAMEDVSRDLPPGFDFAWSAQSLEEVKAGTQAMLHLRARA